MIAPGIEPLPIRHVLLELFINWRSTAEDIGINVFGTPHHREKILVITRGMWIQFRVGIGMMHPVHDAVSAGAQVRRSLRNISHNKKEAFPEPAHGEGSMRSITMKKEGLGKKRQVPMKNKKDNNRYHKN